MKRLPACIIILLALSCAKEKSIILKEPVSTIVSGKVNNFDPDNPEINLYVNRLGHKQEQINTFLDSTGNFHFVFETYIPTDVLLQYTMNVSVLVHPGDSLHVIIDGQQSDRPGILESIQFSGDAARLNKQTAVFQKMYFSNPVYRNWDARLKAQRTYPFQKYEMFLDTIKNQHNAIFDEFCSTVNPNREAKIWAKNFLDQSYYDALSLYPIIYRQANNLRLHELNIPFAYYEPLFERLPVKENELISGSALSGFINRFHYDYVFNKLWEEEENKKYVTSMGLRMYPHELDSLMLFGVLKYTTDSLLKQMVLTEMFSHALENNEINFLEKYKNILDLHIKEPFLKEPLLEYYNQVFEWYNNPRMASDAVLKKLEGTSVKQMMDSLFLMNKSRVIYIDCWATWCGPCLSEFPNSKELMNKLAGKEVSFVYLCIDSDQKSWKAKLAELQLGGQHLFLNKQQSSSLRNVFDIRGIPYYLLFDRNGVLTEKGSHLRPGSVKKKIEELLQNN